MELNEAPYFLEARINVVHNLLKLGSTFFLLFAIEFTPQTSFCMIQLHAVRKNNKYAYAAQCNSIQFSADECSSIQLNKAQYSSIKFNSFDDSASFGEARSSSEASPFNAKESVGICRNMLGSFRIVLMQLNTAYLMQLNPA